MRYAGNKTDFGAVLFAQFYYCFASKEVETHGHAAVKRIEPALYKSENNSFKQFAVKIAAEQSVAAERTAVFPQIILPHFSYLFRFSYLLLKILMQKTHKKQIAPHICANHIKISPQKNARRRDYTYRAEAALTEAAHIFSICATTIARQQCFKKNRAFLRHFEDFFNKKMLFLSRRDNVRIQKQCKFFMRKLFSSQLISAE